jgi:hypothetical protein
MTADSLVVAEILFAHFYAERRRQTRMVASWPLTVESWQSASAAAMHSGLLTNVSLPAEGSTARERSPLLYGWRLCVGSWQ